MQLQFSAKKRRERTTYTKQQIEYLERIFQHNRYPDVFKLEEIAKEIQVQEDRIQVCLCCGCKLNMQMPSKTFNNLETSTH